MVKDRLGSGNRVDHDAYEGKMFYLFYAACRRRVMTINKDYPAIIVLAYNKSFFGTWLAPVNRQKDVPFPLPANRCESDRLRTLERGWGADLWIHRCQQRKTFN